MMLNWARTTCGMMGRSPDFMNVTFAAWAAAADYFARGRPEFGDNIRALLRIHPRERHRPDPLADQPAAQPQRVRHVQPAGRHRAAGDARDRRRHRRARRARAGHAGPLADEIAVYSPRLGAAYRDHSPFAVAFAIPCGTPGLQASSAATASTSAARISTIRSARASRRWTASCSSTTCWCRGSACSCYGDVDLLNGAAHGTHYSAHSSHQGAAKNLAKCEFVLGVALLMTETLGNKHLPHTEERHRRADAEHRADARAACAPPRRTRSSTSGA